MKIYDISLEISESMAVYKDNTEKKPLITATKVISKGDGSNESRISIDSHTGTHADAPFHMIDKGERVGQIGLKKFIGKCAVLDFSGINGSIGEEELKRKISFVEKDSIILLKTKKKIEAKFDYEFCYLNKEGASFLASKKIKTVGIDSLGIEREQPLHDTHKILFNAGISIVEGLELSKIKEGRYFFAGLPLKVKDGDAAPMRAVLIEGKFE